MRLIIGVADEHELRHAAQCGATETLVLDGRGGAPAPGAIRGVAFAHRGGPVTVSLGVQPMPTSTAALAATAAVAQGATTVLVGLRGFRRPAAAVAHLRAVVDALADAPDAGVVATGYADAARLADDGPALDWLPAVAAEAGCRGVSVDTAVKDGRNVLAWADPQALEALTASAHGLGLSCWIGGEVRLRELRALRHAALEAVVLRSGVCANGARGARLDAALVRRAFALCSPAAV